MREKVRLMRENLVYQEQLLEQLMVSLEQHENEPINIDETSSREPSIVSWCPPESDVAESMRLSFTKLRKIEQPTGSPDILVGIKRSWIGRVYQKHLKQIPLIRGLIIWLWRNWYPVYTTANVRTGSRVAKRWRPLVKLAEHVETLQIATIKVFDAARVDTPIPKVFPEEDQSHLVSPHDHYVFPPVYVAELGNALVYGGTNLVFMQDAVICHDLYDFERDYTSEELHGRHVIDVSKRRMRLLKHDAMPEKIALAATFVDACASNYAHWLTEVLPRIAAFCTLEQFANVPVIVNDGLHRNIMESLALIVGPEREIITLPVGRAVQVDRLYVTSVAGYVPFERRDTKLENHSHGLFCPPAFQVIRDRCFSFVDASTLKDWPKKIYLRRTSEARSVTNGAEIEQFLLENGYVAVETEKLSFGQQVLLFSNAVDVISPTGAALANAIFCRLGTKCSVLMSKHENMIYRYWLNLLTPQGIEVNYALGTAVNKNKTSIHSNFYIGLQNISQMLNVRKRA